MELKDKITKEQEIENINQHIKQQNAKGSNADSTGETSEFDEKLQNLMENKTKISEATAALQVLGYNKREIEKAFEKLDKKDLTTEELIKKGLSILGK